jgi:hypothetical protein
MSTVFEKKGDTWQGGFVRTQGNPTPAVVTAKITELPLPDAEGAQLRAAQLAANARPGHFPKGPSPLRERSTKLACLGIPSAVLEAGSKEYQRTVKLANSYKRTRQREMYIAHGHVSAGVGALLAAASLALSGSRFLYELAASTPVRAAERGDLTMPQILKMAASLSDSARQNELAAWELCAREAIIRRRNDTSNQVAPWVVSSPDGKELRRVGRPRKALTVAQAAEGAADAGRLLDKTS